MLVALAIIAVVVLLWAANEFNIMARDKAGGYKFLHTKPDDKTSLGSSSQTSEPVVVSSV